MIVGENREALTDIVKRAELAEGKSFRADMPSFPCKSNVSHKKVLQSPYRPESLPSFF